MWHRKQDGQSLRSRYRRQHGRREPLYEPLEFVLMRAPLLPVESYCALSGPPDTDPTTEMPSIDREACSLLPADSAIRLALAVGSLSIFQALERTTPSDTGAFRLIGKLLRYLIRMSTRPTPYGLFAGVALVRWGARTDLSLAAITPHRRIRPDMGWLLRLVFALEADPSIRRYLRYIVNPLTFIRAGRVFLPESISGGDTHEQDRRVSVGATNAVRRILEMARTPIGHQFLVSDLLATTSGATPEKVEALVTTLWEQSFLLTDLRPPLTTDQPARYVARRLAEIPTAQKILVQLLDLLDKADAWDRLPLEEAITEYRALVRSASAMVQHPQSEPAFQVDMALPVAGDQICSIVAEEIVHAAEVLLRLTPYPSGLPNLEAYRRAFVTRYGEDHEVPLLELVDANFGLAVVPENHGDQWRDARDSSWRKNTLRAHTLLGLACTALRDRTRVVELNEETLASLETWPLTHDTAPLSLDVNFFVGATSRDALDAGDFQVVIGPNVGAQAAGRYLGRFADLLGSAAVAALGRLAEVEASHVSNVIWAELVYLPRKARSANVAIRPSVRMYEIALDTIPGVDWSRVIPISDLVVGVRKGRLSLRWPARNAEVRICSGHMLNPLQASRIGRLLA